MAWPEIQPAEKSMWEGWWEFFNVSSSKFRCKMAEWIDSSRHIWFFPLCIINLRQNRNICVLRLWLCGLNRLSFQALSKCLNYTIEPDQTTHRQTMTNQENKYILWHNALYLQYHYHRHAFIFTLLDKSNNNINITQLLYPLRPQ